MKLVCCDFCINNCRMTAFVATITSFLLCLPVIMYTVGNNVGGTKFNSTERIIIDTDAGVDDAVAILALLGDPLLGHSVEAITCVRGNTEVANVEINVLKILKIAKRLDIPVYPGAAKGLLESPDTGDYYGKDGMGDANYPEAPSKSLLQKQKAASYLAEIVHAYPGKITILSIGPMTNLALAARLNVNFTNQVKNLVALGGTIKSGTINPMVEFNVFMDPVAISITLEEFSQANKIITLLVSETIRDNYIDKKWRKHTLGKLKNKKIEFLNRIERNEINKKGDSWLTYDVFAAAILMKPEVVLKNKAYYTDVETFGRISKGVLIIDYNNITKHQDNTNFVLNIDKQAIKEILLHNLH